MAGRPVVTDGGDRRGTCFRYWLEPFGPSRLSIIQSTCYLTVSYTITTHQAFLDRRRTFEPPSKTMPDMSGTDLTARSSSQSSTSVDVPVLGLTRAKTGCITCRLRKKVRSITGRAATPDVHSAATRASQLVQRARDWRSNVWVIAPSDPNGYETRIM